MSAKKIDKVVLTNATALRKKYGAAGLKALIDAVDGLIAADAARGLNTQYIPLDDVTIMRGFAAPPVNRAKDVKQNKAAIDAIYVNANPDYLLILGSSDVVAQPRLKNPLNGKRKRGDEDPTVPGDLMYACEAPYGSKVNSFLGPTRVVGRLPDLAGSKQVDFLLGLLDQARKAEPMAAADYQNHFVVTAQVWEESTRKTMRALFNNSKGVLPVPPKRAEWPRSDLENRIHLINCHGASHATEFFGQPTNGRHKFPISLRASYIKGKIAKGTVVAAECCYGGQLGGISHSRKRLGICATYLSNGAWGFIGSSTIAYGDSAGTSSADLLCRYFLESVLNGASLGRAFLEARQQFAANPASLPGVDQKTLAQFNLYGDPSIVPIAPTSLAFASSSARRSRRVLLFAQGLELARTAPSLRKVRKPPQPIATAMKAQARKANLTPRAMMSFDSAPGPAPRLEFLAGMRKETPERFHLLFARRKGARKTRKAHVPDFVILLAREQDGVLQPVATVYSH